MYPATFLTNTTHLSIMTQQDLAPGSLSEFWWYLRYQASTLVTSSTRLSSCTCPPPCRLLWTTGWGTDSTRPSGSRLSAVVPVRQTVVLLETGLRRHAPMVVPACLLVAAWPTTLSYTSPPTAPSTWWIQAPGCLSSTMWTCLLAA